MKKLMFLIILFCLPVIISAQEITNLRNQVVNSKSRDSIMQKLLPFAENWRQEYNSKSANQLTPFYAEDSEYISSNVSGYQGNKDLIAIFQNKKEIGGSVDSLLILSLNSSCDRATLFIRVLEKVNRGTIEDRKVIIWQKIKGSWIISKNLKAEKS